MTRAEKGIFALCGAVTVGMLALCVFSPFLSIALLPVCLLFAYAGAGRFPWLLLVAGVLYGGAGLLVRGVNLFLLGGAVLFFALYAVSVFRKRLAPLTEMGISAGVCLLVCVAVVGVFALVWHTGYLGAIVKAIAKCKTDSVVSFLSRRFYKKQTLASLGHVPLVPADELYAAEVLTEYAHSIGRMLEDDALWYVTGFGAFVGILTPFGALGVWQAAKRNGSVRVENLRLGRDYVKAVVFPVLVFSLLGFYEPMNAVVRTVFNILITLPTAFCGVTLLYYMAKLFRGKARILAVIVFWLLMAVAALFWEWGLIVLGFLGLGDAVLDMRKLLDWALS